MMPPAGLLIMVAIYVLAGVMHFVRPAMYRAIMPPYIPAHQTMVLLSGVAEIVLGIALLIPATRSAAAWGIVLLLIAIFPANVYMATAEKFRRLPGWVLWGRLPLQALLIWWALTYT